MTHILDWKRAEDPRDVIHLAVQALAEGRLLAVPTESGYAIAASALQPKAAEVVAQLRTREPVQLALALRSYHEALDYAPTLSPIALRLLERAWPGPLVLHVDASDDDSLLKRIPPAWLSLLVDNQKHVHLHIPAHEAIDHIAQLTSGPIVLAIPNPPANPASAALHPEVALAIDDGPRSPAGSPTSVQIQNNHCRVVSPGLLDDAELKRLTQFRILLVCTGNTCRSPMAERLMRSLLQSKFQWEPSSASPPIVVQSAGVSAMPGGPASMHAIEAMRLRGIDLSDHQSSPVTERALCRSDLVLTMTQSHRQAILGRWPDLAHKVRTLSRDGIDISDPFGKCIDSYQFCADQLQQVLLPWVEELDASQFAVWDS